MAEQHFTMILATHNRTERKLKRWELVTSKPRATYFLFPACVGYREISLESQSQVFSGSFKNFPGAWLFIRQSVSHYALRGGLSLSCGLAHFPFAASCRHQVTGPLHTHSLLIFRLRAASPGKPALTLRWNQGPSSTSSPRTNTSSRHFSKSHPCYWDSLIPVSLPHQPVSSRKAWWRVCVFSLLGPMLHW